MLKTCKVKHDHSPDQAGTGAARRPELTIFLAFYFIVGEQHMEEESEHSVKKMERRRGRRAAEQRNNQMEEETLATLKTQGSFSNYRLLME